MLMLDTTKFAKLNLLEIFWSFMSIVNQIIDVLVKALFWNKFGHMKIVLGLSENILRTPISSQEGV
jgi:hypothetical protein